MSWVTAIWAMLIGGCIALAVPHLLVGIWLRRGAHLLFVLAAAAVIGIATGELNMMRAPSVGQFEQALWWSSLAISILLVALICFVYLYLGTGRPWLALAACAFSFACLVVNFVSQQTLVFREITGMRHFQFLGETVSAPIGEIGPWVRLGEVTNLVFLAYVIDASIGSWRKGTVDGRRRAVVVGGSIAFFVLLAASLKALTHRNIIGVPYVLGYCFAGILVAMALELGYDLFSAEKAAEKLQISEDSLHESEERFRTMADAAPVLIWMSGPDKLCTFFNKAWLEFTGRKMEQELGAGWADGVYVDDFELCLTTYNAAFDARKPFTMKYRLRRHDGEYRFVTDTGGPRFGPRGNFRGYIGACVDITDFLNQEKALTEFEERVTLVADAAHLGVWELNTNTNELWISDKARELFQFEPNGPVTVDAFRARIHPEDRAIADAAFKNAIDTQGSYEIEYRALLPDGTLRWMHGRARCVSDEKGTFSRLLGVSMDVTEQKQAQELFQLATEAAPSGTILVDRQGKIVLVNAQTERLFNYWRDELVGKPIDILVPDHVAPHHPALRNKFFDAPKTMTLGVGRELFGRRKDGSEFPVEIGLNPIKTPQGLLVLATVLDISARKAAEEQARKSREQIDRFTRISLLGEMTASIAHELNQPLSAIASNAGAGQRFLDKGQLNPETLREILEDVGADARRAHDVIQHIRNTIRKGAPVRERINLNDAVNHVAHSIRPDARIYSCKIETSLDRRFPEVEGDPVQIQQVLINLVTNAFDAMTDTPAKQRKVEIKTERNGDATVCVSVRDHGIGIQEEAREHLFEQFFTTKSDGLGMGLAIVRSIIESHGGRIAAENVDGGGARFHFTLPIVGTNE